MSTPGDAVRELCDLLETEPLRVMDPSVEETVNSLADRLEGFKRPVAAERLRVGWTKIKEKFRKEFWLVSSRPGSMDDASDSKEKPSVRVMPGCLRCRKPVSDYVDKSGTSDWMLCVECRKFGDGPEIAPFLEQELKAIEKSVKYMTANMDQVRARLARCR